MMLDERLIPRESDKERLKQLYQEFCPTSLNISSEEFVRNIGLRIYTEWHFNVPFEEHKNYVGQAFEKFITDETWYLCEKENVSSMEEYNQARDRILKALVKCSLVFFTNVDENNPSDKRNLRCDLSNWL